MEMRLKKPKAEIVHCAGDGLRSGGYLRIGSDGRIGIYGPKGGHKVSGKFDLQEIRDAIDRVRE